MELNIDDEWSEFLSMPNIDGIDSLPNIPDNEENCLLECPKAGDIYISTKTNIAFLNENINLSEVFWKIPILRYCEPSIGVVKKQMKFNSIKKEELYEIQKNLENYKCVEQNVITSIDNPSGRIKFKDIRKVSIGVCKKDIISYRSKKKSAFYNCFVMIVRLKENDDFKEYHVKVFNTGKLEIPGIQSDETFYNILDLVIQVLSPLIKSNLEVLHDKTHTVLINSNFNCGFFINREALFNILKNKYCLDCIYDPCSYPGIQCKFFYYHDLKEQTGIQKQDNQNQTEVSFMIFRTGSVLIVGKCEEYVLRNIYEFLKETIAKEFSKINVKIIDSSIEVKQKAKKIRKRVINVSS
tara:strand:+ start:22120 stop:23178 length:1059 start_codon:yes stop_codon:yes gene_type:complete